MSRAKFEEWAARQGYSLLRLERGGYDEPETVAAVDAWRAGRESLLQEIEAAGFVVVPKEATEEMACTVYRLDLSYMPTQWSADRQAIYNGMVAAAPKPPIEV